MFASIMTGSVAPGSVDYFTFDATANDFVTVILDNDPNGDGIMESSIELLSYDGSTVLRDDRGYTNPYNVIEPSIAAPLPGGTLYVRIGNGGGGDTTEYSFVVIMDGRTTSCAGFSGCPIFSDGFESGNPSAWTVPW